MIRRAFWAGSVVVGGLAIGLAVFIATAPHTNRLIDTDAVLLHIGGEGERLDLAMELWDDHADYLIIPTGSEWDVDDRWCGMDDRIICMPIEPETTLGEARLLAHLVEQNGWSSVATVTTDYHLRRAAILDRRCAGATVVTYGAENELGSVALFGKYLHEMGGLALAPFQRCST